MLFFEAGYVFDTSDNTKQRVTEKTLIKALRLGVPIQGAKLDTNGNLQLYNFRAVNLQRLKALRDIHLGIGNETGYLYSIAGDLGNNFELTAYANGLSRNIRGNANGVIKLDSSLFIQPFRGDISSGLCFDITALSNDIAFLVYSSLVKHIDTDIFYNKNSYIPNVIIDETKHSLFLFGTLLLKGEILNPGKISNIARGYKETVIPLFKYWYSYSYNILTVTFDALVYIKELETCDLYSSTFFYLLGLILNKGTEEYTMLRLSESYLLVYGVLPDKFKTALRNISEALKRHYTG